MTGLVLGSRILKTECIIQSATFQKLPNYTENIMPTVNAATGMCLKYQGSADNINACCKTSSLNLHSTLSTPSQE